MNRKQPIRTVPNRKKRFFARIFELYLQPIISGYNESREERRHKEVADSYIPPTSKSTNYNNNKKQRNKSKRDTTAEEQKPETSFSYFHLRTKHTATKKAFSTHA